MLASKRNESLHFGSADLAASMRAKTTNIGEVNSNYGILTSNAEQREFHLNDMWHYAIFKIVLNAHAFGLRAIDCPFGNFSDEKGFNYAAKSSYTLGFDGKMVIHPSQIPLANNTYLPTKEEVTEAEGILLAMKTAEKKGKGAIAFNGEIIRYCIYKTGKKILLKQ